MHKSSLEESLMIGTNFKHHVTNGIGPVMKSLTSHKIR